MKKMLIIISLFLISACASYTLHTAVSEQDYRKVQEFVQSGADINAVDGYGFTPLIAAAYHGNAPIVKYLCDKGADVDRQDGEGWTALLYAAFYGHEDIVKILLANNASVHFINKYGYNALWYAQKNGNQNIVRMLKEKGAKPLF